ncbi:MAG: type II toxin-antitoxin system VapC family toxin [Kiloniellales bacterium]|nr:type II toxin-antitoxin system VapC family toxin [Kiloniellales bacterium]
MRALLDTHVVLWWFFDDPRISEAAAALIADPSNELLVSSGSAWEIATKHRIGKLPEAGAPVARFAQLLRQARMRDLPITAAHALAAGALPGPHRDPFDRMLIAQADLERLPLVSNDPVFNNYSVELIW